MTIFAKALSFLLGNCQHLNWLQQKKKVIPYNGYPPDTGYALYSSLIIVAVISYTKRAREKKKMFYIGIRKILKQKKFSMTAVFF